MSYNPNIPQVTDSLTQSELQIKANFLAINTVFADNHIGLTKDFSVAGMHRVLTLRKQTGATPDPTTTADQVGLYNKLVGGVASLFFRPNNSQTAIQLSYPSIVTGIQSTNPTKYFDRQYSFVAGPFVIYGGIIRTPASGDVITLLPSTTLLYVDLIVTNIQNPQVLRVYSASATNIAANQFTIRYATNITTKSIDVYYLAVGV
jgi:hypothetical protein